MTNLLHGAHVANKLFSTIARFRLLLVMLVALTASTAWGATTTYTFTSKAWADSSNGWTSGKDGNALTSNQGVQVTTGVTGANATTKNSFTNISSVAVQYCTNASKGAGSIKIQVGSNTQKSFSVTKPSSSGTTLKTATFTFDPNETGKVKITVDCTTNSVYIYSVTITTVDAVTCTTNPTVSAGSNSSVTTTTATVSCSGGITSLGSAGCSIESYGFVYGTSSNPTISNTKVQVGITYTTTGTAFSKELTGLTANTTYYVRPYATNGNGTAYGTQTSFKTLELPKYTVTLNAGPGTCAASVTEASAGAGVTLLTPTLECGDWEFAGWATSAVANETSSKPATLLTGSYKPSNNITLYAVYQRTKEGEGGGSTPTEESKTYTFSEYEVGTQYAEETYELDDDVTINIKGCHINTQLRVYGGQDGTVISSKKLPGRIVSMGFNMGYKADELVVSGSTDGSSWTEIGSISTTTSYKDYTLDFGETNYTYFKLNVEGSSQIRIAKMSITYESTSGGGSSSTTYYHSTPECAAETTHSVTFNANGHGTAPTTQTVKSGQKATEPTAPTATGYTFGGWYKEPECTTAFDFATPITGDIPLYAKWTKLHTITWKVNGEEYTEGDPTTSVEDGNTITQIPTAPKALSGCSEKAFVGWSDSEISEETDIKPTTLFTDAASAPAIDGDKTFHAVFADEEGGNFSLGQSGDFKIYANVNSTYYYAKEDAEVDKIPGTTDSNEATIYTFTKETIDEKEYYSICNGSKYIGYSGSSSSLKETAEAEKQYWSIEKGTHGSWRVTSKNASTRALAYRASTYNTFRAYSTSVINGTEYYDIEIGGGTTYSAYTTLCDATKATITYDLNGGTGETCAKTTVTKDVEFTLCDQIPTKDGYTFAGWTDGVNPYAAGEKVTVNESTTFYAKWTAKTITITWDQNYTDCPEAAISTYIYDGEDIEMPEDPTRSGYQFDGWYTASTDGTKIREVGTTNKPTDDVTYYAHWAELYTVTFIASGQVYVVQEDKYLGGANLELPADPSPANYACDGYIFDGWSVAEKTIEEATKPELITNPTITKDETYYAVWKKASSTGAGETILFANFDDNKGTGGNDGKWNDNIATATILLPAEWDHANGYGANQCIKLGTGSRKGSVTTPELSQLSGSATLSFKAAAWSNNNEQTDLVLSITGGGTLDKTSVTMIKGAWETYEVTIKDGTSATRITFAGKNTSDSRFFLDEVKVTTSGGYNYTTSPSCGPTIVAKEGMWVTSSNGQSVKVNVPIAVKSFTTTATITGTSTSSNFVVTPLENVSNGINDVVEVLYTPTTANTKESTTITLTAKDAETEVSTTTFTLNGRSLPDQFAIVVDKASEYYALPANMPSEGTYTGFGVEVNAGTATAAPKTHLYTARAVHSTRFTENGTALRLVGNNDACLWASAAKDGTSIRNYANISNATDSQYEWSLYTEDGETYRISCTAVTEEGRILRMYGQKFGMYKSGSDAFHFLPVECTSTPLNVSVSAARTSATISWTNADACNVEVYNGSTKVQTISAAASPVVVSNLAESTAYTFTLTPADNESCVVSGAFTTTGPTIDIVEWETNGILIQVDKDNELDPKVVIKGEEEHGNVGGNVADELFFSKYFEAHAENKLLAIFNGTTETIDLTGYTIKSENGTLDLSQFGQTKGKVASNEEIILVYYDANYSAKKCAEEQQGYENWNILTEKSVLAFSGRGSLGLYKNDVLIDVIGSTFPSGELTKIGKSGSPDNCGTEETVRLHIDGVSVNDQSSFFCFNGDNIKTDEVETNYALSTNRCLLIRKNTVTSGANAVATNKATADATCGDVSSTFTTLGSEWSGFRIGSGKSSTDEIKNATCDGLGYVGGFDYNNYYRTLETLDNSKTLIEYTRNPDENTYFIKIEDLAQYSCLNIQLQLTDNEGNVLTEQTSQVPILVAGEKSTTDEIFSAIVKDSETSEPDYETSKIRCATCDVVILENATLTKAAADVDNDVNQVRDIYIYPGGKLVVPANATDYSVNNVSLRRVQDEVSAASILTPLKITSSSKTPVYVDIRINSKNWHWMTLPYNCNIADVTWNDGSKAIYNSDWFLMYYDGESRSKEQSHYENHWKVYEGTTIEAGKGYIVGITGHPTKSGVQYELRFPMAIDVLTADNNNKTVPVNAWGAEDNIAPNKKGWNLVGNPYLDYYQRSAVNSFNGLRLGGEYEYDETTGKWNDTGKWDGETKNVPYIVIPVDGGWTSYDQVLASEIDLKPFTSYFVQVGNSSDSNGQQYDVRFETANRGRASLIRRAPSEIDEVEEPVIVGVSLTNTQGESDKTSLVIDDQFTDKYEMNADFFKWFGDYYKYYTKPVLYTIGADDDKLAFNAISEELATQPISLGMYAAQTGDYTFTLDRRSDLSKVQEVWLHDATQDIHINLLQESYTFHTAKTESAGRFFLSVKMAPKVSTEMDNVTDGTVWATTQDHTIFVNGLLSNAQLWIYDATGKLLHTDHTMYYQHSYSVPQSGTYFVRVQNTMQTQTIKVVVE